MPDSVAAFIEILKIVAPAGVTGLIVDWRAGRRSRRVGERHGVAERCAQLCKDADLIYKQAAEYYALPAAGGVTDREKHVTVITVDLQRLKVKVHALRQQCSMLDGFVSKAIPQLDRRALDFKVAITSDPFGGALPTAEVCARVTARVAQAYEGLSSVLGQVERKLLHRSAK